MHRHVHFRFSSLPSFAMMLILAATTLFLTAASPVSGQDVDKKAEVEEHDPLKSQYDERDIANEPPSLIRAFVRETEARKDEVKRQLGEIHRRLNESSDTIVTFEIAEKLAALAGRNRDVPRTRMPQDLLERFKWKGGDTILLAEIKANEQKLRLFLGLFRDSLRHDSERRERLEQELDIASEDATRAQRQLDESSSQAFFDNRFKQTMSMIFAILIALVIGGFFLVISLTKGAGSLSERLLSDGGLQFVTIFVLIIAVVLFGVLKILEGRELAAILSGIAGYILGRSTSMTKVTRDDDGGKGAGSKG